MRRLKLEEPETEDWEDSIAFLARVLANGSLSVQARAPRNRPGGMNMTSLQDGAVLVFKAKFQGDHYDVFVGDLHADEGRTIVLHSAPKTIHSQKRQTNAEERRRNANALLECILDHLNNATSGTHRPRWVK